MEDKIISIKTAVACKACGKMALRTEFADKQIEKYTCKYCGFKFMVVQHVGKQD